VLRGSNSPRFRLDLLAFERCWREQVPCQLLCRGTAVVTSDFMSSAYCLRVAETCRQARRNGCKKVSEIVAYSSSGHPPAPTWERKLNEGSRVSRLSRLTAIASHGYRVSRLSRLTAIWCLTCLTPDGVHITPRLINHDRVVDKRVIPSARSSLLAPHRSLRDFLALVILRIRRSCQLAGSQRNKRSRQTILRGKA
jgi:hypothetical protein